MTLSDEQFDRLMKRVNYGVAVLVLIAGILMRDAPSGNVGVGNFLIILAGLDVLWQMFCAAWNTWWKLSLNRRRR